jgi:murein DD-endopeptidase MepM/ murein hydrolase activator NlpD
MLSESPRLAALAALGSLLAALGPTTTPADRPAKQQTPASAASPELRAASRLSYWPSAPRQGQTLFLRWQPAQAGSLFHASATWDGTEVPLVARDGALAGVVGLKITERTGPHILRLRYRDPEGQPREQVTTVRVGVTPFPVRHLTMKRSTERLYNAPFAKREDALVSRAVRTRTPDWLWRGAFRMPTTGRPATPFGVKRIRNQRTVYYHRGYDLAAPVGRLITAPNAGRVVLAKSLRKYGNTVVLDHGGGVTTLYMHMSALLTCEGARVTTGQPIGRVGMTGVATGPHLHWALYVRGTAVNPVLWTQLPAGFASVNSVPAVLWTSPPSPLPEAGRGSLFSHERLWWRCGPPERGMP